MSTLLRIDPQVQLRALYMSLITRQDRFDEFKDLLATYPDVPPDADVEPEEAARVRESVNERVREWTNIPMGGLSPQQVIMLRDMLVTHRLNLALSPWKEANTY
jgi:hypothetical protein